jgi:hypothetical protein
MLWLIDRIIPVNVQESDEREGLDQSLHQETAYPRGGVIGFPECVVFGTATFIAMGFALSSFASTVETYGAVSNLAFFPMMLLSGVYFRLDSAPAMAPESGSDPASLSISPRAPRRPQRWCQSARTRLRLGHPRRLAGPLSHSCSR